MGNSQGADSDGHACLHCTGRIFLLPALQAGHSCRQKEPGLQILPMTQMMESTEPTKGQSTWTARGSCRHGQRTQTSELAEQQCLQRMLGGKYPQKY